MTRDPEGQSVTWVRGDGRTWGASVHGGGVASLSVSSWNRPRTLSRPPARLSTITSTTHGRPGATLRAVSRLPSYHLLHVTMRTCTHIHAHSHMHTHSHAHTCTRAHSQTRHAVCLSPVPSRMEVGVLCSLACPDPGRPPAHRRPVSLRMRPLRLQQLCLREGPRASSPRGPGHTLSPRSELRSCRAGLLWLQFLVAL